MRRLTRALLFALGLLALPAPGWGAAVGYDNSANANCRSNSTPLCTDSFTKLTYSFTVGSGSNRALAVLVTVGCGSSDTAPTISTVTYAGVSLSLVAQVAPASGRRGELWALPAGTQPTSGANNVVVTLGGSLHDACSTGSLSSGAFAATGVDQTTTFASTNTNSGSGTSATLSLSVSGADDLGFDAMCSGDGITSTTETSRWSVVLTDSSCGSSGGATAAGGDVAFSWTIPSDSWIVVGGAFKAAGAGGAATPRGLLLGVYP